MCPLNFDICRTLSHKETFGRLPKRAGICSPERLSLGEMATRRCRSSRRRSWLLCVILFDLRKEREGNSEGYFLACALFNGFLQWGKPACDCCLIVVGLFLIDCRCNCHPGCGLTRSMSGAENSRLLQHIANMGLMTASCHISRRCNYSGSDGQNVQIARASLVATRTTRDCYDPPSRSLGRSKSKTCTHHTRLARCSSLWSPDHLHSPSRLRIA